MSNKKIQGTATLNHLDLHWHCLEENEPLMREAMDKMLLKLQKMRWVKVFLEELTEIQEDISPICKTSGDELLSAHNLVSLIILMLGTVQEDIDKHFMHCVDTDNSSVYRQMYFLMYFTRYIRTLSPEFLGDTADVLSKLLDNKCLDEHPYQRYLPIVPLLKCALVTLEYVPMMMDEAKNASPKENEKMKEKASAKLDEFQKRHQIWKKKQH